MKFQFWTILKKQCTFILEFMTTIDSKSKRNTNSISVLLKLQGHQHLSSMLANQKLILWNAEKLIMLLFSKNLQLKLLLLVQKKLDLKLFIQLRLINLCMKKSIKSRNSWWLLYWLVNHLQHHQFMLLNTRTWIKWGYCVKGELLRIKLKGIRKNTTNTPTRTHQPRRSASTSTRFPVWSHSEPNAPNSLLATQQPNWSRTRRTLMC